MVCYSHGDIPLVSYMHLVWNLANMICKPLMECAWPKKGSAFLLLTRCDTFFQTFFTPVAWIKINVAYWQLLLLLHNMSRISQQNASQTTECIPHYVCLSAIITNKCQQFPTDHHYNVPNRYKIYPILHRNWTQVPVISHNIFYFFFLVLITLFPSRHSSDYNLTF